LSEKVLVICEKPTAARRIAEALDDNRAPQGFVEQGVPYFVATRGQLNLVIVSALGHLFSIVQKGEGWTYPVYDYEWVPIHKAEKGRGRIARFIEVIRGLSEGVSCFVSACDHDMEGSLIGYMVLLHVCGEGSLGKARRMLYSSLTEQELNRAWEGMLETLDFPLIHAGRARHEVDWLFGINLSRALTLSLKNTTGHYKSLSAGRVQGPTLNFIRDREVEIRSFVPTPFWVIKAYAKIRGKKYPLEYQKLRLEKRGEAEGIVEGCRGRRGTVVSLETESKEQAPPTPFNLGDLQREAYYRLKYSPRTTLQAAERLYLAALISYPRTSSQRLPPGIDLRGILKALKEEEKYSTFATELLEKPKLAPKQGRKEDPAHPAIHPTGKPPSKLGRVEGRVYDLICRRFMASLDDPAVSEETKAGIDVNGHQFYLKGSRLVERGWTEVYAPYLRDKGVVLPTVEIGQKINLLGVKADRRITRPPSRLNPGSLLKLMEDEGIGTKATRTDIIDTLYKRGYIIGQSIRITDLGMTIVEALGEVVPRILSVEMTRNLEEDLERVQTGEKGADTVVSEALGILKPVLSEFKAKEEIVGREINGALLRGTRSSETLGVCPDCGTGEIRVLKNKKTGKRFAGCSNYYGGNCQTSYPLPQKGRIKATGESCQVCGAPIIRVLRRKRKPWILCINIDCPGENEVD
jgi:DNA topoisomerase-1